jgi:hypothetical protein
MKIPGRLALAAGLAMIPALGTQGFTSATAPTFNLVDTGIGGTPEVTIDVGPNGNVFVGGWNAIGRSTNGGLHWDQLQPAPVQLAADRVLAVDHQTGRVMIEDTALAGCGIVQWSDDQGSSWSHSLACTPSVTDHAKIGFGKRTTLADPTGLLYKNIMYFCANGLVETGCAESPVGGQAWLPTAPHGINCAFQGDLVGAPDGTLYEPSAACGLAVRKTANNGLTWTEITTPFTPGPDTPDLAVTPDGTVYLMWIDTNWQPEFARSSNGGASWSGPFSASIPGLTSSALPAIVAGGNGKIALQYYGTTDNPAGWDHNPGNAPDSVRWNGYIAVVTDAGGATPTVAPVQVNSATQPLQYGCMTKLGSCLDNIADYSDIAASPGGVVYGAFVDGCLAGCVDHASSTASEAVVAVQTGGSLLEP